MISDFPLLVVGLTAVITLVSFFYEYPLSLKKLSLFWVFNFLVDLAGHITKHLGIRNHWIYNIYFWSFYIFLAYLYHKQIKSTFIDKSIRCFYVVFPLMVIAWSILYGVTNLQTSIIVIGGMFIVFLAAAYFRQLYLSEENGRITRDPWFWFSFGFLVYFGGTTPFLGMLNYLWEIYPEFCNFYYLYVCNSFAILLNILIITGFLCRRDYRFQRLA